MSAFSDNLNITQLVTHKLGSAIISGEYQSKGALPSEATISTAFAISRSATREAIKTLAAKGLIVSRPRQGIRIRPQSEWNMFDPDILGWILCANPSRQMLREFTQMRIAIEPEAAALAAQAQNSERIAHIGLALEQMRAAGHGGEDALSSDIAFHTSLLLASDNRFFIQMKGFVETALRVSIRLTNTTKGVSVADVGDHHKIYAAIKAGDADSARLDTLAILTEVMALID